MNTYLKKCLATVLCMSFTAAIHAAPQSTGPQVRIKDVTHLAGEHRNTVTGVGLVAGLAGTGGSSEGTKRALILMQQNLGIRSTPQIREIIQQAREKTDNVSLVAVTATLPPHAKAGQLVDVTVYTLDDAESLNGGFLIETPLSGVDDEVYALASGPISINGGNFGGQAATVTKNHPTTGRVSNGAVIERAVPSHVFQDDGMFHFLLRQPEYETAKRITHAINDVFPNRAMVVDPSMIAVRLPFEESHKPFEFIAKCQDLYVTPDARAKVVINERTGTIVFNENVRLSRVAITHGNLIVSTIESPEASQPNPFSEGETAVLPRTSIDVVEQGTSVNVIDQTATVADLAASLNSLGVSPRDLSSIFQMLKETGALHAELEIK